MGLLELLRRMGLLACLCTAGWYWLESPAVLIELKRADFPRDYQREFGKREYAAMGAMEMGREFLRKHANPGSVEAYAKRVTEHRSLEPGDEQWTALWRELPPEGRYYSIDQPPVISIAPRIEALFAHTKYLVLYMPVRGGHLEIRYQNRPRGSKAPAALVYPKRGRSLPWLGAGLALYLLLPWPKKQQDSSGFGRIPIVFLDTAGCLFAGFFFVLPLWAVYSSRDVLGEELSTTLFCWSLAGLCSLFLLRGAGMASYRILVDPSGLHVRTLWGSRWVRYSRMEGAGYTVRNDVRTGIFVRTIDGEVIRMDWASLLRFEVVLEAMRQARIPAAADVPA